MRDTQDDVTVQVLTNAPKRKDTKPAPTGGPQAIRSSSRWHRSLIPAIGRGVVSGPTILRFKCCTQHLCRKARGGFWLAAKGGETASALLVESAVDALSVLTRPPPGSGHALVVSTAGVCTAVPQWLEAFGLTRIDCGFDADDAGDRATDALAHRDIRVWRLRPEGAKDWNAIIQERKG